jgi:hypothetical protein
MTAGPCVGTGLVEAGAAAQRDRSFVARGR